VNNAPPETRMTVLVDNEVHPDLGLLPEHGLSVLIERAGLRILFDTGQGDALFHNAAILGVPLYPLNIGVLSHGHYDHTGGLLKVATLNPGLRVVTHPAALLPHLAAGPDDRLPRHIGIPFPRESLLAVGAQFDFVEDFAEIAPGVWFSGRIPRGPDFVNDTRLAIIKDNCLIPDPMEDDVSLLLETPSGPVVVLGCAHAGLEDILSHITERLRISRIHALIGGTHLGMLPEGETGQAADTFERYDIQVVGTCHCTGAGPNRELQSRLGSRFVQTAAGTVFVF
jgi:7,8-dihydropterin-6-yl-methyl-4-(beta-D-ribofuranosyl)aminobenzene 5'-phosphate synthase